MRAYYNMLRDILETGEDRGDRTGVGTRSIFGYQARYPDIANHFPLDTTREINFQQIVGELLWFLRGNTNIQELVKQGFHLWSDWPAKNYNQCNPDAELTRAEFNQRIKSDDVFATLWGDCGPIYSSQWRKWEYWHHNGNGHMWKHSIDQIANLVEDLKKNPLSRRHIVSAWNVADIPAMIPSGLPPCHVMFQFYCSQLSQEQRFKEAEKVGVRRSENDAEWLDKLDQNNVPKYRLHCMLTQRSLDSVLGGPYNIVEYSLLTMMLAQQCNMVPGDFIHSIGDAHIYHNHREALEHQLARKPHDAPTVKIKKAKDIFSYTADNFELIGYDPHPPIRYPIAV